MKKKVASHFSYLSGRQANCLTKFSLNVGVRCSFLSIFPITSLYYFLEEFTTDHMYANY